MLKLDAVLEMSHWRCIAASTFDKETGEEHADPEAIGECEFIIELRIPRVIERGPEGYSLNSQCPNRPIADTLAALLDGVVSPCSGGKFGNSWIVQAKIPVVDGQLELARRLTPSGRVATAAYRDGYAEGREATVDQAHKLL